MKWPSILSSTFQPRKGSAVVDFARRQLVEAFTPLTLKGNAEKYRQVYGRDLDANPCQDVIAALSVGNIAFVPLCFDWGARNVGYESAASTSSLLNMRWAFMRGAARQHRGLTATYRSCNFGVASTIFSNGGSYQANSRKCEVSAGGVRIIELK